ncbi:ABC transporter substrate-binding protein [Brevibacterium sp. CS2]|uniref:ABC transporter substrate-binding protein n=1 Tax=Brevibacterium sp. CS2 TaxID=2575923 RepID=UPI0020C7C1D3|nr:MULTISPECIES: ABC transporter substrate-binding protein [Actinomycetes]MCX0277683.1 ABC transporter substrate-binding protein [Nocardia zapadnayensis]
MTMSRIRFPRLPRMVTAVAAATVLALAPGVAPIASAATEESTEGAIDAPAEEKTLRIATAGQIDSFNPFTTIYLTSTGINRYVYENLVQYDAKDGSPTEGLAESWETSEDGMTWTFTLREGMKWSDDEPITAEDVVYTYTQMMEDPAGMGAANGSLVQNFDTVEAPDDSTVVITLTEPQAPNPGTEIPVVPEHVWSAKEDAVGDPGDTDVVGSGPFVLESYEPNQSITLRANPNFWRGAPQIDTIQYIYYTNSDAQVQALRSGEVDFITGLTPEQVTALEGADNVEINAGTGRRYTSISFNSGAETPEGESYGTGNEALTDVAVRQALRQGIDIDTLREQVMQGYADPATSFIPSAFPKWHLPEDDEAILEHDVEAAKQTLEDAGWTEGADGIREKDGEKLSLRLLVDSASQPEQAIGEFLGPWLADLGVELEVEASDADTISSRTLAGDYDMYITGWSINPDPDYQLGINTCASRPDAEGNGPSSQDGYCNPEFDELYAQQHTELDEGAREELVREALRLNYTDTAQIALWYPQALEAYRSDRFDGFTTQPEADGMIAGQAGYWGFYTVEPVSGESGGESGGLGTGAWIGIGIAVLAGVGVVIFALTRRKSADDRA